MGERGVTADYQVTVQSAVNVPVRKFVFFRRVSIIVPVNSLAANDGHSSASTALSIFNQD